MVGGVENVDVVVVGAIAGEALGVDVGDFLEQVDSDGVVVIGVEYFMEVPYLPTYLSEIIPLIPERVLSRFQVFVQRSLIDLWVVLELRVSVGNVLVTQIPLF